MFFLPLGFNYVQSSSKFPLQTRIVKINRRSLLLNNRRRPAVPFTADYPGLGSLTVLAKASTVPPSHAPGARKNNRPQRTQATVM